MSDVLVVLEPARLAQDLREALGRSARRILLQTMMRLHDLNVKVGTQELIGFTREPKKRVHADAEIGREQDRNRGGCILDRLKLFGGVTGRPDDQRLSIRQAKLAISLRRIRMAEV